MLHSAVKSLFDNQEENTRAIARHVFYFKNILRIINVLNSLFNALHSINMINYSYIHLNFRFFFFFFFFILMRITTEKFIQTR